MEIFTQSLNRLRAFLDLEHKGLNVMPIVLKNQELDVKIINELQEITKWLKEHIEVKFVNFIFHIDETSSPVFKSESSYLDYRKKCKNLFNDIKNLPQVVIIDMKGSFENVWCEFLYHANLGVAHSDTIFNWNHLKKGILPISNETFKQNDTVKNFIVTSQSITASTLSKQSSVCRTYTNDDERKIILSLVKTNVRQSSPTGVIQLKHAFNSKNIDEYEKIVHYTYLNNDWSDKEAFSSVHDMKEILNNKNQGAGELHN
jgi:enoyl-CoA hydratase/carnithine racemase